MAMPVEKCLSAFSNNFLTFLLMCLAGRGCVCRLDAVTEMCSTEESAFKQNKKG